MEKSPPPCRSIWRRKRISPFSFFLLFFSSSLYTWDVVSDMLQARSYAAAGQTWWSRLTIAFVFLPAIPVALLSLYSIWASDAYPSKRWRILGTIASATLLGPVFVNCASVALEEAEEDEDDNVGHRRNSSANLHSTSLAPNDHPSPSQSIASKSCQNFRDVVVKFYPVCTRTWYSRPRDTALLLIFFEVCYESLPQTLLQIYIVMTTNVIVGQQVVTVATSIFAGFFNCVWYKIFFYRKLFGFMTNERLEKNIFLKRLGDALGLALALNGPFFFLVSANLVATLPFVGQSALMFVLCMVFYSLCLASNAVKYYLGHLFSKGEVFVFKVVPMLPLVFLVVLFFMAAPIYLLGMIATASTFSERGVVNIIGSIWMGKDQPLLNLTTDCSLLSRGGTFYNNFTLWVSSSGWSENLREFWEADLVCLTEAYPLISTIFRVNALVMAIETLITVLCMTVHDAAKFRRDSNSICYKIKSLSLKKL